MAITLEFIFRLVLIVSISQTIFMVWNVLRNPNTSKTQRLELDAIRSIPSKERTVEDQLKFLDAKYPKKDQHWTFKDVVNIAISIVKYVLMYLLIDYIFRLLMFEPGVVWSLVLILGLPFAVSWLLKKFGFETDNTLFNFF